MSACPHYGFYGDSNCSINIGHKGQQDLVKKDQGLTHPMPVLNVIDGAIRTLDLVSCYLHPPTSYICFSRPVTSQHMQSARRRCSERTPRLGGFSQPCCPSDELVQYGFGQRHLQARQHLETPRNPASPPLSGQSDDTAIGFLSARRLAQPLVSAAVEDHDAAVTQWCWQIGDESSLWPARRCGDPQDILGHPSSGV